MFTDDLSRELLSYLCVIFFVAQSPDSALSYSLARVTCNGQTYHHSLRAWWICTYKVCIWHYLTYNLVFTVLQYLFVSLIHICFVFLISRSGVTFSAALLMDVLSSISYILDSR